MALGIVPIWLFLGVRQSRTVNGALVWDSSFNLLGVILAGIGLAMAVKLLWTDGPWAKRWWLRTVLATLAAVICLLQFGYSLGLGLVH